MNVLVTIVFLMYADVISRTSNPSEDKIRSTKYPIQSSTTLVTALYDIGRGEWNNWRRSFNSYLHYFTHILRLGTQLVIYCEKSTADKLKTVYRDLLHDNVYVVIQPFHEIEFEQYRQIVKNIMKSEEFFKDNKMLSNPEGFSVDYILLMNNKLSFMMDAIRRNIFNSSHYFWLDAGYGHGDSKIFPNYSGWEPTKLLSRNNSVTFTKLANPNMYKDIKKLYKQTINPAISGGFFGGHRKPVTDYYHLYNKEFKTMLTENIVDDDQTISLACYFELPRLFNFVKGDWFDAFKLYSK